MARVKLSFAFAHAFATHFLSRRITGHDDAWSVKMAGFSVDARAMAAIET
ncbi:MAG: hypothetical protein LBJ65_02690 [Burkholderia sp.]|jgi:hypothetical protein|nr:hypothetical protein [Burkholderia sp.]MDR0240487.1 hypothetical protein [Burkholderia sp.]